MPIVVIQSSTAAPSQDVWKDLFEAVVQVIVDCCKVDRSIVFVHFQPEQRYVGAYGALSEEPFALSTVEKFDITPEMKAAVADKLTAVVVKHLKLKPERFLIRFPVRETNQVAAGGKLFG